MLNFFIDMSANIISLREASKAYNPNSLVLRKVNLEVPRGEFLFVAGDSGAGKSTLLKLLTGEEVPSSGTALFDGGKFAANSKKMQNFRRRLGVVHQDYRLLKDRSVFDNVATPLFFGRAGTGMTPVNVWGAGAKNLVEDALSVVGLSKKIINSMVKELSGGEQQRVAIARAIINFPDLLIADEPTGSLDHDHTWTVMDLLQKLNLKGMTIVVATHDRDIIRRVKKRTVHLNNGTIRVDERDGACIF
jgi:cell division transport system ATP-binding protein